MHTQSSEENITTTGLISFLENIKFQSPQAGRTHSTKQQCKHYYHQGNKQPAGAIKQVDPYKVATGPSKGYALDVMLLEPSSSRVSDFDNWYRCVRPLLKPIKGKLLIATLPVGKVKTLYKNWLADGKPRFMLDFIKCGHIERYGVDWYDEMRKALNENQFAVEYCGDFSILN